MSDLLDRATAALRSQIDDDNRHVSGSDAWIRDGLSTRQTRLGRRAVWLTIGLVLASSVGWAAITGRLTALTASKSSSTAVPNRPPLPRLAPDRLPSRLLVVPAETASPQETSRPAPTPVPLPLRRAVPPLRAAPAQVAESQAHSTLAPENDRYAAYRIAHRLHFHTDDPKAALAAWTRFLVLAPDGSLADEARYLSAICLIRLGRIPEATTVLDGLAAPSSRSARRDDARRQLDRFEQSGAASATER
ncbi:MAG: Proline-rich protein [Myxococcales bacterium]|nr:Proline-rich protein [Myxococcales bacterium]